MNVTELLELVFPIERDFPERALWHSVKEVYRVGTNRVITRELAAQLEVIPNFRDVFVIHKPTIQGRAIFVLWTKKSWAESEAARFEARVASQGRCRTYDKKLVNESRQKFITTAIWTYMAPHKETHKMERSEVEAMIGEAMRTSEKDLEEVCAIFERGMKKQIYISEEQYAKDHIPADVDSWDKLIEVRIQDKWEDEDAKEVEI